MRSVRSAGSASSPSVDRRRGRLRSCNCNRRYVMHTTKRTSGFAADKLAKIPTELQRFVDDRDVSGFVTLIWRRGAIAQVDSLGWRDIERKQPMQRDTLFRIA